MVSCVLLYVVYKEFFFACFRCNDNVLVVYLPLQRTGSFPRLEVLSLRKIAENTNENLIAKKLHLEAMTDMLGRSHSLAQQLAQQLPRKANLC